MPIKWSRSTFRKLKLVSYCHSTLRDAISTYRIDKMEAPIQDVIARKYSHAKFIMMCFVNESVNMYLHYNKVKRLHSNRRKSQCDQTTVYVFRSKIGFVNHYFFLFQKIGTWFSASPGCQYGGTWLYVSGRAVSRSCS